MTTKRFAAIARRSWLNFKAFLAGAKRFILQICTFAIPLLLFLAVALGVYEFGFRPFWSNSSLLNFWLSLLLDLLVIFMGVRLFFDFFQKKRMRTRVVNVGGYVFVVVLSLLVMPIKANFNASADPYLIWKIILYGGIVLAFIVEASHFLHSFYKGRVSPAMLFVISFALIILVGAFMLKLPNATRQPLSALDALFTSTSAVCVTGLAVVDTATEFTTFGQFIILILIQVGALGIMTFAGLFAYAVAGGASIKTQLAFKDVMSGKEIGNIMRFTYNVVLVTFLFEMAGAMSIYLVTPNDLFPRQLDKIFYAVFHSVSAFCNAGFSTLPGGLYQPAFRFNYGLQFFIAILIILGGMGFPIVFNLYRYAHVKLVNFLFFVNRSNRRVHFPRLINLNSRLALFVSGILLLAGFVTYFIFEQNHTLADHPTMTGKLMTSFFGSVTPRTAGFNTVNIGLLSLPTIMIYLLLMWIGASPGSTGGGIKTTTFGVAVLNMVGVLKGKDRTEFHRSEVSTESIRRAFVVIFMSLIFIGISVFLVTLYDSRFGLVRISFEVFSAFSTVGLTLGITPQLSDFSKVVIMLTMFVGRIGTVTLMVAFIRQAKKLYYRYPQEDITF
ncbi:MAG: TrkH family potassium uptake protein [Flavisolibacter sp.]